MKKQGVWRIFSNTILVISAIVMLNLLMGLGDTKSIFNSYDNLKPDTKSGLNKSLHFVEVYTRVTGDTTLAINAGVDRQTVNQWSTDGTSLVGGEISRGAVSHTANYTEAEWATALKSRSNDEYFKIGNGYRITEHNGVQYLVEQQSAYWNKIKGTSSNTVSSHGCWLFAQSNAANALNGTTYSVADILETRNGAGYNASWNTNIKKWTGKQTTMAQRTLSEEAVVFNMLGCKATQLSSGRITAQEAYNKMKARGFNNTVYIIYGHKPGVLSSGIDHWLVVVGLTNDGFQLLGNGNRKSTVTMSEIGSSAGTITAMFTITKK